MGNKESVMHPFNVRTPFIRRYGWIGLMALALWALLAWRPVAALSEDDFLPPEEAFAFSAAMSDPRTLVLDYRIAPGYYMYRERFALVTDAQEAAGEAKYPPGEVKYDPTFEQNMEVYHDQVMITVPVTGDQPFVLTVTSQGCADAGLCYPPADHTVTLTPTAEGFVLEAVDGADSGEHPSTSSRSLRSAGTQQGGSTIGGRLTEGGLSAPGTGGQISNASPATASDLAAGRGAAARAADTRAPDGGMEVGGASGSGDRAGGLGSLLSASDMGLADALSGLGWIKTAGVFWVLGLLLALTPCVLPMIPILSSIIVGGTRDARPGRWRGLGLAAAYVLGMSVVYTALGVAAGLSGVGLAAWLQTPWVLGVFAAVLAVLAIATFGAFDFQMPGVVQSWLTARSSRIPGGRATGALAMGAISALIVGPCVAAPLAGALLYISRTGDVVLGAAALFALAWGMGVPLLVVGASSGALLPRVGPWMDGVKQLFGMLLLATAWWMVVPITPTWLQMMGWALLAIVGAVMLRAFDALPGGAGVPRMFAKGAGLLLALVAAAWLVGAASGGRDVLQPLSHWVQREDNGQVAVTAAPVEFVRVRNNAELDALLAQSTQPVMLDFYADWCVSCREMERFTYTDPVVSAKLSRLLLVQADVTQNNADDRALLKRFRLFGPPGILFFEPGGAPVANARVVGFQNAAQFGAVLDQVLRSQQ